MKNLEDKKTEETIRTEKPENEGGEKSGKRAALGLSFWLSCGLCLLPAVFALFVYDRLPESIVTHWNAQDAPDGWSSKAFAVFGIPLLMLALHVFVWFMLHNDPRRGNITKIMLLLGEWSVPVITTATLTITYLNALDVTVNPSSYISCTIAVLIVMVGNYLPKCRPNYTVGIRLPWTLDNEENWVRTHRFAGKVWVLGGVLLFAAGFFRLEWLLFLVLALLVVPPALYSYCYYKKQKSGEKP